MKFNLNKKLDIVTSIWSILSFKRKRELTFLLLMNFSCAINELINLLLLRSYVNAFVYRSDLSDLTFLPKILQKIPINELIFLNGILLVLFLLIGTFLRITVIYLQNILGPMVALDIGSLVYKNIINMPYSWHVKSNSNSILGSLSFDLERVRDLCISFIIFLVNSLLIFCIAIPLIFLEPRLMITVFLITFLLFSIIYKISRSSLQKEGSIATENYQAGLKLISESLDSIKNIIIDHNQEYFIHKYVKKFKKFNISFGKINSYYQYPKFFVEGILICSVIVITLFLNYSDLGKQVNYSILGTILFGIYKLLIPFQQVSFSISNIRATFSSWEKIKNYLNLQEDLKKYNNYSNFTNNIKVQNKVYESNSFISFKNVSFRYDKNSKFIIKNLNLSILKGQSIGMIGYSGSGKTTCGDLLGGILKPTEGKVLINGIDINISENHLRKWHNSFSFVPQNIFMSDDTITNNIAFGIPQEKIDFNKVIDACKKSCLHQTILQFPNSYKQIIGEKGKKLSGGQIQRLAIARALYKDAECIVFDEATSALDNKTENELIESLKFLDKNVTTIFISHRLSIIKNCDYLFFFGKDLNITSGNFDELYERNVEFRKFVNLEAT